MHLINHVKMYNGRTLNQPWPYKNKCGSNIPEILYFLEKQVMAFFKRKINWCIFDLAYFHRLFSITSWKNENERDLRHTGLNKTCYISM